ncbi:Crp/Fnr family transcriptional regulator [Bosea sp. BIWAKO-01]|uniref:Crp/Fnr family transcriptional regulator n=1 Tax=Bosea sp. BIWAKO-01 TaxID=506668 RepID=UPI000852E22E|nr:Crp/Fnr family transcriptional regulator [Bosea sp. BIWAKO-01]GAU86750.1 cAMP-binding proteins - catabolite gene activator and regulatory subunit of cAMP-dependent protein kinases [Bosea sp. BIWAKO-01]
MPDDRLRVRNRLLAVLSDEDFAEIFDLLDLVELPRRIALSEANEKDGHSYFLESGVASIIAVSPGGLRAEVGLFGRDGMTPSGLMIDAGLSPFQVIMQITGNGYRIKSKMLARILAERPAFLNLLTRYAHTLAVQTAYTALSNAVHSVDERLARWILMCHDRSDGQGVSLTHDFLAVLLAVRRPSVTTALHGLEGRKFILAERGLITIVDRPGLAEFAADAYGTPEGVYDRLINAVA